MASVVHLSGEDGVLEAAARVRAASGEGEIALVVPEGAPVLANPLFLRALREERADRALVLVTPDARARAMASGCRVPAYSSLSAYEQKTLDPTEPLERARALAIAEIGRERERRRRQQRRALAAAALAIVLLLVVGPSAEVVVAADVRAVGPLDLDVRTLPGGAVPATRLVAPLQARADGAATGVRADRTRATGTERFTNASTQRIDIATGTIVSTGANVQFRTTQAKTLPASTFPPLFISEIQIPIEAVEPGPGGNVARNTITRIADGRIRVTNDQATSGGDEKRTQFVQESDVTAASAALDRSLDAAARQQVREWMAAPPLGLRVEDAFALRTLSRTPGADLVGKEVATFQLTASVEMSAYAVDASEPRASALRGLSRAAAAGSEVVLDSVNVEVRGIEVSPDGLVWHLRARASQASRLDEASLRFALVGQDRAAAAPLLAQRGLRVLAVRSYPSWWPRLPLFPLRIDIRSGAVALART